MYEEIVELTKSIEGPSDSSSSVQSFSSILHGTKRLRR